MSSEDVAAMLAVSVRRVRQLAEAGTITGERVGRDWIFKLADVQEYLTRRRGPGRPPKS
jgi:excisionase family DNA binding protein